METKDYLLKYCNFDIAIWFSIPDQNITSSMKNLQSLKIRNTTDIAMGADNSNSENILSPFSFKSVLSICWSIYSKMMGSGIPSP